MSTGYVACRRVLGAAFCSAVTASASFAGGVRIADRPQIPPFGSIQQAVNAALDGETLIVGEGTYWGFQVVNRKLAIVAATGAAVVIDGTVHVEGLAGSRWVVLSGLEIRGADSTWQAEPALRASSNAGHLWVLDCVLKGGKGLPPTSGVWYGHGGTAALLTDSARVVFARSTVRGGAGGHDPNWYAYDTFGGRGGAGIDAQGTALALYDGDVAGGKGGAGGTQGGNGGHAIDVFDYGVFVGGSQVRGGDAGATWDYLVYDGADGGHGLIVDAGAQAQIVDSSFAGGAAGHCPFCQIGGIEGSPMTGSGVLHPHVGTARELSAEPLTSDASLWQVSATGEPGDRVFVHLSATPAYAVPHPVIGVRLVPQPPPLRPRYVGTIGGSGVLNGLVRVEDVVAADEVALRFAQGVVIDLGGTVWPASPLLQAALDPRALVDCDGNGADDLLDVLSGAVSDVDHDLEPDACAGD